MTVPAIEVQYAYRSCERITRREAANFFYGIRLLPRPKRQAMSAVYAFARRVDDIGDGDLDGVHQPHAARQLAALAAERGRLAAVAGGHSDDLSDPVITALGHAQRHFGLPLDALEQLIEGVEMDVRGTRYETFDELVVYCRNVAGSIGRLCLAVFTGDRQGTPAAPGATGGDARPAQLADELGVAMQLTNILRDVREDRERGRTYVPAEDLRRFGCDDGLDGPSAGAAELIRFEAQRTRERFDHGLALVGLLDARSAACVRAMTGIYRGILDRIVQDPAAVLSRRISLPAWEKSWIAARSLSPRPSVGAAA